MITEEKAKGLQNEWKRLAKEGNKNTPKADELLRRFVTAIEIEASTDSVIKEAKEYLEITDYLDTPIIVEDYGKIEQAKNEAFREAMSNSPIPNINFDDLKQDNGKVLYGSIEDKYAILRNTDERPFA